VHNWALAGDERGFAFRTAGGGMDKKSLSERDICTKFVTPALR
jgi:hypothetical protein